MAISQGLALDTPNTGSHVFGFVMALFNFLLKIVITYSAAKFFSELGGSFSLSSSGDQVGGSVGFGDQDAYENMGSVDVSGEAADKSPYQAYSSPPVPAGAHPDTQHL